MTEAFKWNLTPTERRMAETVFALSKEVAPRHRAGAAVIAVRRLRGVDDYLGEEMRVTQADAMLAELRSEPYEYGGWGKVAIRVGGIADRYHALLERIVAGITPEDAAELSELTIAEAAPPEDREKCERFLAMLAAIAEARAELAR